MSKPHILVIGSANMDLIVKAQRLPVPGETVLGGEFSTAPGGKGANQAVAAARLGAEVSFVGRVGQDAFGEALLAAMKADGVDLSGVFRDPEAATGVALICVDTKAENQIVVAPGANGRVTPEDVECCRDLVAAADVLLLQLEIPLATVVEAVSIASELGKTVVLNPAPGRPLPEGLLARVNFLTPNEGEMSALAEDAQSLLKAGVGTVIVTVGSEGADLVSLSGRVRIPGFQVEAVDTTAAGDAFNGALACALGEGQEIESAVRFANAAAALAVTKLGAQPSLPRWDEVRELLAT